MSSREEWELSYTQVLTICFLSGSRLLPLSLLDALAAVLSTQVSSCAVRGPWMPNSGFWIFYRGRCQIQRMKHRGRNGKIVSSIYRSVSDAIVLRAVWCQHPLDEYYFPTCALYCPSNVSVKFQGQNMKVLLQ